MKNTILLSVLLGAVLAPLALQATHEERQGRLEISQGWVDRHNDKLEQVVKDAVKGLKVRSKVHHRASLKRPSARSKSLYLSIAKKHNIPASKKLASGSFVPLVALYQTEVHGQSFLTADYADEITDLHCSSDIYWKIGLRYYPLFEGTGYRGCARVFTMGSGQEDPIFFEVATYQGGERVDKTIYTFNRPAVSLIPEHLFTNPEDVRPEKYVLTALEINVWLEGYTLYRDIDKDGFLEVVNTTQETTPRDLQEMLKKKYRLVDNDFDRAFRKVATFYKWDAKESKFHEIGDHYY
jgi:hypothetical protein